MKIQHSRLLILLVSIGQLSGLVLAVVWFVSWLETSLINELRSQVLLNDEFVMADQPEEIIRSTVQHVVSVVYTIGISTAFVLAGFTILVTIAVVQRYENRLSQINSQLQRTNDCMTHDLGVAAEIQRSLLPKAPPEVAGVDFAWAHEPCDELAGDILNVFLLDDDHIGLYVLDVSGHGVASSLLSTTLNRELSPAPVTTSILKRHVEGSRYQLLTPKEVAQQLNRNFPINQVTMQYFTLVYGILNLQTYEFRFVAAGHPPPIYLSRTAAPDILKTSGVLIGLTEDADFEERSIQMHSGDRLVMYSDGITETMNSVRKQFGMDGLIASLQQTHNSTLNDSISSVLRSVANWRGNERTEDDMTVLAIEIA